MNQPLIRVAICDDDAMAARSLAAFITAAPSFELVGVCSSGQAALELVEREQPDVLLLDVRMPGLDGYSVAAQIHADQRHAARPDAGRGGCRVIYLSSFPEARMGQEAVDGIVAGSLSKDLDPTTLVSAIHGAMGGLVMLAPQTTGPREPESAMAVATGSFAALRFVHNETEANVLTLLCQGAGNAQIAQQLNFSESWVKATLSELMRRTGTRNRVELVLAALAPPTRETGGSDGGTP